MRVATRVVAIGDAAQCGSRMPAARLEDRGFEILNIYAGTFLNGWLGHTLVAALFVPIEEPGAWRVRDLVAHGVRKLFDRAAITDESR